MQDEALNFCNCIWVLINRYKLRSSNRYCCETVGILDRVNKRVKFKRSDCFGVSPKYSLTKLLNVYSKVENCIFIGEHLGLFITVDISKQSLISNFVQFYLEFETLKMWTVLDFQKIVNSDNNWLKIAKYISYAKITQHLWLLWAIASSNILGVRHLNVFPEQHVSYHCSAQQPVGCCYVCKGLPKLAQTLYVFVTNKENNNRWIHADPSPELGEAVTNMSYPSRYELRWNQWINCDPCLCASFYANLFS